MSKFKLRAIETNLDVYPPIFKGQVYEGVDEVTTYYQGQPPSKEFTIEVEEYDQFATWAYPVTNFKRYQVPGYLFVRVDEEVKPKCNCGQESTWLFFHKRSCPSDKHSSWCEVYKE